jgi:hypothetical protein
VQQGLQRCRLHGSGRSASQDDNLGLFTMAWNQFTLSLENAVNVGYRTVACLEPCFARKQAF